MVTNPMLIMTNLPYYFPLLRLICILLINSGREIRKRKIFFEKSLVAIVEGSIFEFKTYDRQDNLIIEYNDDNFN